MSNIITPAQLESLATNVANLVAAKLTDQSRLVDRDQLAKILGLSVSTIDRRRKQGDIPFIRSGSRILFDPSAVILALSKKGAS